MRLTPEILLYELQKFRCLQNVLEFCANFQSSGVPDATHVFTLPPIFQKCMGFKINMLETCTFELEIDQILLCKMDRNCSVQNSEQYSSIFQNLGRPQFDKLKKIGTPFFKISPKRGAKLELALLAVV